MSSHDQVSTNQTSLVSFSVSSVVFSFQPTVMIVLSHGEGNTTFLFSAGVVTITESLATEISDISTPVVNVVLNSG